MYSCMSDQVTIVIQTLIVMNFIFIKHMTLKNMKHLRLYFLSGDIFVSIAILIWTNILCFTKSGPSFSWSLLRKLSSCAKAAS